MYNFNSNQTIFYLANLKKTPDISKKKIMEWFNSLEPSLKVFWIVAIISSAIFLINTVITFIGFDSDVSVDIDTGDAMPFFSFRNLVNFFLGVGWGGVCFYDLFDSKGLVILFSTLTGLVFVLLFFMLIKVILKLNKDNTFNIKDTLDKTADVYLPIPAEKSGSGKIQISVKGSVHEIDAITAGEKISVGSKVRVLEIIDNQTVLITKI